MSNPLSYLHDQLEQWRAEGTYQRLRILESASAAEAQFDGKQVINLASNNYLGLTTHPKLREAALEAIRKFGVGSGAVRTISGTMSIHMELEERIAAFKNVEACVVFQSGFAANAGTVSAILTPEDHIISDELNHASIIDGCRLSRAKIHVFPHKDASRAEEILSELDSVAGRKLLIYFYPAADTPGCTTQSCAVRDAREDLSSLGVDVVGISPDVPEDQLRFDEKFGLGFPLLADTDHAIAEAYDVWGEKMNYGKTYMGIIRSSFLIDEDGRIEQAWYKVSPKDTVPNAQKALAGG